MNTTDYFTYVNAMFLFCTFTCGLLVWAVIRGYILKGKLTKEQDSHLKATLINTKLNKALEDEKKVSDTVEKLLRQVESEVRELQGKLTESEKQANGYKAEFIAVSNELEATKAKVRKRDANGKFLPSGNGRVRTPKKLKLVTDLGENEVIHCKTAEERLAIRKLMHEAGLKWASGHSYMKRAQFIDYGKKLCYIPSNGTHGSIDTKYEGRIIHPASDFIARPKRVKKVKSAANELTHDFDQIKAESPKLVHGLTVKNPTDKEAKMIFDEAKRLRVDKLGIEIDDVKILDSTGKIMSHIWYSEAKDYGRSISWRIAILQHSKNDEQVVTAKDFVQRMQNGRG